MAKNKPVHSKGKPNPALARALLEKNIENRLKEQYDRGLNRGCLGFEVMALMILHDKFGMEDEAELRRFCDEVNSITDSVLGGYLTVSDMVKTLQEESGFTMTEDQLIAIDPSLAAYCDPKNE